MRALNRKVRDQVFRGCVALSRRKDRFLGRIFDLKYGISTTTPKALASDTPSQFNDNTHCIPTTYPQLARTFGGLPVAQNDVFVDFGCGLGRGVCFAARYPFAKIYGVEITESLAARARTNVERLRLKGRPPIEIVCCSAEEFDCRLGSTFYFYNPFGERTMAAVLANIKLAATEAGRPVRIIYNNPVHKTLLDDAGWLIEKKVLMPRGFDAPPILLYETQTL
jgi:precorrin-6B methylase 2